MPDAATGLLLLDKPAGPSSFRAIARLRPVLGRRVGHAGTLDPFATGLMLVLAGRATRLAHFLTGLDKRYRATVALGVRSTTGDPEGELARSGADPVGRAAVEAALAPFRGPIEQVPPAASAVHVDGERAYARFRRGEEVVVPARRVTVHALELVAFDEEHQEAELDLVCSSGTYVRSIGRDLGEALGTGAHVSALRRLEVGPFSVADAATPEVALERPTDPPHWRDPAEALPHLPALPLDPGLAADLRHGRRPGAPVGLPAGPLRALDPAGRLVAVVHADGGLLVPDLVLQGAS